MEISAIMAMVLTAVDTLVKIAPQIYKTAQDVKPFAVALYAAFMGKAPTADETTILEGYVDDLAARLQIPLSPALPGDPDYK